DRRMLRQEAQRAAGILDLFEANHTAMFALAIAAAAHVEAQRDIAVVSKGLCGPHHIRGTLVAAEAMQHQERGPAFPCLDPVRNVHNAGEAQAGGGNGHVLFTHGEILPFKYSCCWSTPSCRLSLPRSFHDRGNSVSLPLGLVEAEFAPARFGGVDIPLCR